MAEDNSTGILWVVHPDSLYSYLGKYDLKKHKSRELYEYRNASAKYNLEGLTRVMKIAQDAGTLIVIEPWKRESGFKTYEYFKEKGIDIDSVKKIETYANYDESKAFKEFQEHVEKLATKLKVCYFCGYGRYSCIPSRIEAVYNKLHLEPKIIIGTATMFGTPVSSMISLSRSGKYDLPDSGICRPVPKGSEGKLSREMFEYEWRKYKRSLHTFISQRYPDYLGHIKFGEITTVEFAKEVEELDFEFSKKLKAASQKLEEEWLKKEMGLLKTLIEVGGCFNFRQRLR
ncbi:MAG: hypothetical protein ABIG20_00345 [archaeon]